jgi:V-type H+-transporting ATPase proteolipid subunit
VVKTLYQAGGIDSPQNWGYGYYEAYKQLGAGLCCGLSSLAAGLCIGVVGDAGVRGNAQRDILIALILMMIFAEALALYGFIVAIVLSSG